MRLETIGGRSESVVDASECCISCEPVIREDQIQIN